MPVWVAVVFKRRMAQTMEEPEIPPVMMLDSARPNLSWDAFLGQTKEEATRKAIEGRHNYGMPGRLAYTIITGEITEVLQEEPQAPQENPRATFNPTNFIEELLGRDLPAVGDAWRPVRDVPFNPRRRTTLPTNDRPLPRFEGIDDLPDDGGDDNI